MSLREHPKAYGTAVVVAAFAAGVLVTLGFKDLYPDLERRFQQSRKRRRQKQRQGASSKEGSQKSASAGPSSRRSSYFFWGVQLEDYESDASAREAAGRGGRGGGTIATSHLFA